MPTSVKAFFDQKVPAALATNPEKAKDVAAVYLFKVSGPDGGTWTVDLVSNPPTAQAGTVGSPNCTVEATDDDFRSMIDGGRRRIANRVSPDSRMVTLTEIDDKTSVIENQEFRR